MTNYRYIELVWLIFGALAIGALFTLYQNPLMEIYLANWKLC